MELSRRDFLRISAPGTALGGLVGVGVGLAPTLARLTPSGDESLRPASHAKSAEAATR